MPEGLEVYILSVVLKELGYVCFSKGKHLILKDSYTGEWYDYSFGLAGKIKIDDDNLTVHKINHSKLASGDKLLLKNEHDLDDKLGIDWLYASKEELTVVVRSWLSKKKQIVSLIIDQKEICGIGVVYASEIFHLAGIHPTLKTNLLQFLNLIEKLVDAMISVRDKIKKIYLSHLTQNNKKFANEWFYNLYRIRKPFLLVYKKSEMIKVAGREFYI